MSKKRRSKIKYYHASTRLDWKPGDIIAPKGRVIYLTTSPKPHWTLFLPDKTSIGKVRHNIYKVLPLGKVKRGMWADLLCYGSVQVLECLGESAKIGTAAKSDEEFSKEGFKKSSFVKRPNKNWRDFIPINKR